MSDSTNMGDFGDTSGFYPRRREGMSNFFIGVLTGIAVTVGVLLIIIGIGGPNALPLPFLSSPIPSATATSDATITFTPSITFTPTSETPSATPTVSCPAEYEIQSGDLLSAIAERCGVSVEAIKALNPTIDANNIQVGQKIIIPPPGTGFVPTAIPSGLAPGTVIPILVEAGDNLETIAAKCWSTVANLISLNKIKDPNFLTVGMELKCTYGIATPVPVRISPTFGLTPTYTLTGTLALTPILSPSVSASPTPTPTTQP